MARRTDRPAPDPRRSRASKGDHSEAARSRTRATLGPGGDPLLVILEAARHLTAAHAAVMAVRRDRDEISYLVSAVEEDVKQEAREEADRRLDSLAAPSSHAHKPSRQATRPRAIFEEVHFEGRMVGVLGVLRPRRLAEARSNLTWLADLAGLCLEEEELLETAWKETLRLGATYQSSGQSDAQDILAETLDRLVHHAAGLSSVRGTGLYAFTLDATAFVRKAYMAEDEETLPGRIEGTTVHPGMGGVPPQAMVVPLEWGDRKFGYLILALRREPAELPLRHERVLRLLAAQAANALGVSAFVEAERRERHMAEALQEASEVIDRGLDLDEVLDHILEQVMRVFPCDAANFMSYEGKESRVLRSRGYERFGLSDEDMAGFSLEAPKYENLRKLIAGEAVTVADTRRDPQWVYRPGVEWLRSWAGVPVRFGDEILGFVMLDSATPGAFDESSSRRLMAFAAHAAAAMYNARLYRRLLQEHARLQQVHAIGRNISESLSSEEILASLLSASLEAVGGMAGAVLVPGTSQRPGMRVRLRIPADSAHAALSLREDVDPLITAVAASRRPAVRTVDTDGGTQTALAFPLAAGEAISGVAVLWVEGSLSGVDTWLDVFAAVGQQAGLALSNAAEHAKVQRRLAEMTLLQKLVGNIARRLQADAILAGLTEQLQASLGFPVVQFYMLDGAEYVLKQFSGPRPTLERTPVERGIVGRVLRTGAPSYVPDVRRDPDYLAGLVGTRAEIAVPIAIDGMTIGVLNVETSESEQLDDDAFELLTLLADQVSIALQNASLFEAAQLNVEKLESRVRERTAQLESVLEQAVAAERVKAQFVADVSHELRTPLTNIGLYLELLELSEESRRSEYMATLRRETERLGRLIEQLLAMSHLDTGQAQLRPQTTNLNSLLQVLIGDRSRMIARRGLRLELHPQPDLPDVQVDPQYIMQVLTNLLSNATNYTPQGGRITLETASRQADGESWVTFTVRDTGPGIPEEEVEHVFDRFYRGSHARTSGISGTGLGLPISKEIVERHGGRITLESRRGEGAAFTVWIPLAADRIRQAPIL